MMKRVLKRVLKRRMRRDDRRLWITASMSLTIALAATASHAGPDGWIHDDSGRAPRLSVEQSIWALTGLPRSGAAEWTLEQKVAEIAKAGFDGFMVFLPPAAEQERYAALAAEHGLALTLHAAPSSVDDVRSALDAAKRMRARALVAMIRPTLVSYEEGREKIEAMSAAAGEAGVPFYVETHRGTITQDLPLTARWAESIPGIRIHADLSHFVVSYGIRGDARGETGALVDAVLTRTGMIDGRIGNGNQVQVDIGPEGDTPEARRFARWWKKAMVAWLRQAKPGDVFVFKSELGPPSYSIVGADGAEISDRLAQSIVMRDLGIRTWNEAVADASAGEVYTPGRDRPAAAATAASSGRPSAERALEVEASFVESLRGDSFKIGEFHLAGQPLIPDFDNAKEGGIKSVINLRLEQELASLGFDERAHIEGLGLEYYHFEVGPETIDDAQAEAILAAVDKAAKPCLIHDSNGNRVWGVWALYVGLHHDIPVEKTAAVAKKHDIPRLVIDDFVRDYLARKKK